MDDHALAPVQDLEIDERTKEVPDLCLDCLGKQAMRAAAQDFGELLAESS